MQGMRASSKPVWSSSQCQESLLRFSRLVSGLQACLWWPAHAVDFALLFGAPMVA